MHLLPEAELSRTLRCMTQEQCLDFLDALSESLAAFSSESRKPASERLIHQPLRTSIVTKDNNLSLFMPVSNTNSTSTKIVTAAGTGGGNIVGVINIFSPEGKLLGLLSAAEVTAFRTALATMTLFMRCSSLKKDNIVIFGCGKQAEWHARLALLLLGGRKQIKRITFFNRGRDRLRQFMKDVIIAHVEPSYPGITIQAFAKEGSGADYEQALGSELASSDVIFSCTPATEPNFTFAHLQPSSAPAGSDATTPTNKQRFISLIGSYKPSMHEVDSETLLSGGGKIYVDSKEACLEESGELIEARVTPDQLLEIGDVFSKLGKTDCSLHVPEGHNVVFKCVGMGLMDLVIGKKLLDLAERQGLGMHFDGF